MRYQLARWTGEAGDAAAARDAYRELLPVQERVSGAEHPHTLTVRYQLARWTGEAGDAAGACIALNDLLQVRQRVSGPEHPDTRKVPGPHQSVLQAVASLSRGIARRTTGRFRYSRSGRRSRDAAERAVL